MRERLLPWLQAIGTVCGRDPAADQVARMAILLRFCGHTDQSLGLCDRADSIQPMLTAVVHSGTWGLSVTDSSKPPRCDGHCNSTDQLVAPIGSG